MKTILMSIVTAALMFFGVNALAAERVVITGEPVIVNESAGVYTFPATTTTYTTTSGYYYVKMGDTKRVCYRETQPSLASLNLLDVSFRIGSDTVTVHCYEYNPDYFIVR